LHTRVGIGNASQCRRAIVGLVVVISLIAGLLVAHIAPIGASGRTSSLTTQLTDFGQSAATVDTNDQLASLFTDPSFLGLVQELLRQNDGTLTPIETGVLSALATSLGSTDRAVISAVVRGVPLTHHQKQQLRRFAATLVTNPAIQAVARAGAELQHNRAQLLQDVTDATQPIPTGTIPATGDASIDDGLAKVNALRSSPSFASVESATEALLPEAARAGVLSFESPLEIASLLPASTLINLPVRPARPGTHDAAVGSLATPVQLDAFSFSKALVVLIATVVVLLAVFVGGEIVVALGEGVAAVARLGAVLSVGQAIALRLLAAVLTLLGGATVGVEISNKIKEYCAPDFFGNSPCSTTSTTTSTMPPSTSTSTSSSTSTPSSTTTTTVSAGAGVIHQLPPVGGTTEVDRSIGFRAAVQTDVGSTGTDVLFVTTNGVSGLSVSPSGGVSVTNPLSVGTYTVSGTDSDLEGDTGTWSYTLVVSSDICGDVCASATGPGQITLTVSDACVGCTLTVLGEYDYDVLIANPQPATFSSTSATFTGLSPGHPYSFVYEVCVAVGGVNVECVTEEQTNVVVLAQ